jgi:hypothetical protein
MLFWQKPCYYCGELSKGIDRLDSTKGYEVENCVSCCEQCNYMKLDYTQEEFIKKCIQIAEKQDIQKI